MYDVFDQKIMTDPVAAAPFEPLERSNVVPSDEHHLGRASLDELASLHPGGEQAFFDQHRLVSRTPFKIFEPVTAADQVELAVAVDVGLGQSLGRTDLGDRARPPRALPS